MNRSPLARTLLAAVAFVAAIALAGCETDSNGLSGRALKPIPEKLQAEMARKGMSKESPLLVRIFKQEAELEVWKQDSSGKYALLKTYPICRWSGELGPKIKEGDRQAPEGFYTITPGQMNPASQYYLAFNLGFPNEFDRAHGRSGAHLMVHGDCSSRGCYSMTDEQIAEIYALARESFFAGQNSFQVQAYPFRMTPANLAKHRNNPHMPFWKMLKEGYDHFEVTRLEPTVNVCERRYVFNAAASGDVSASLHFDPRGQCPVYEVPDEIVAAVDEKKKRDEVQIAELISRGVPAAPVKMGTDGGMHEVFVAALQGGRPMNGRDGEVRRIPVSAPGTIPPTVNPPSNIALAAVPGETPTADAPAPAPAPQQSAAHPSRTVAAARVQTAAAAPAAQPSRNFLSGLFTSNNTEAKSSSASPSILDRAASAIGLRGSTEPRVAEAPAKPTKPAAKPVSLVSRAVAQPRPQSQPASNAAEQPAKVANAGAIMPQPAAGDSKTASTQVKPATSASLLSGAAPVMPAGSFGTSWSALR